uniref:Uncharacterized protein n=1 Tax=Glossina pallidipes TaxID=7398 RepID=A0A1A9ZRU6_GLOPL
MQLLFAACKYSDVVGDGIVQHVCVFFSELFAVLIGAAAGATAAGAEPNKRKKYQFINVLNRTYETTFCFKENNSQPKVHLSALHAGIKPTVSICSITLKLVSVMHW